MRTALRNSLLATFACTTLAVAFQPAFAQGALKFDKHWARATAPGASVGGGYLTVTNAGAAADKLVGVSSPVAARTELHEMKMEKDVMRMREVKSLDVPAHGRLELKPGGFHLMFQQLRQPLKPGDKVPVTLKFEKAGEVATELEVEGMGAGSGIQMKHDGAGMNHGSMKMK